MSDRCGGLSNNYTPSAIASFATEDSYVPPFVAKAPTDKFFGGYSKGFVASQVLWEGFTGRFSSLVDTTMEHYLLVPALFAAIVVTALSFEIIGFLMLVGAIGLVTYEIANASANILFDNINKKALDQVYSDLGIDFKEDKVTTDYITVKQNALFYRVLYNATYLNREDSEKALKILSQSDIGLGAAKSLPKDVPVAHRHPPIQPGAQTNTQIQRGDCGIVYYPNHPYILCVMAQAKDENYIEGFLGHVGQIIYQDVAERYKNK